MTENQTCPTPATERRFAFERRRRVAEMSDEEMRQALLRLSPRVRTAVVLRYFEDLSETETADVMGFSRSCPLTMASQGSQYSLMTPSVLQVRL